MRKHYITKYVQLNKMCYFTNTTNRDTYYYARWDATATIYHKILYFMYLPLQILHYLPHGCVYLEMSAL